MFWCYIKCNGCGSLKFRAAIMKMMGCSINYVWICAGDYEQQICTVVIKVFLTSWHIITLLLPWHRLISWSSVIMCSIGGGWDSVFIMRHDDRHVALAQTALVNLRSRSKSWSMWVFTLTGGPGALLLSAHFHILSNYRGLDWIRGFLYERKSGLALEQAVEMKAWLGNYPMPNLCVCFCVFI